MWNGSMPRMNENIHKKLWEIALVQNCVIQTVLIEKPIAAGALQFAVPSFFSYMLCFSWRENLVWWRSGRICNIVPILRREPRCPLLDYTASPQGTLWTPFDSRELLRKRKAPPPPREYNLLFRVMVVPFQILVWTAYGHVFASHQTMSFSAGDWCNRSSYIKCEDIFS